MICRYCGQRKALPHSRPPTCHHCAIAFEKRRLIQDALDDTPCEHTLAIWSICVLFSGILLGCFMYVLQILWSIK